MRNRRRGYAKASRPRKIAGQMNGTEARFADILNVRAAAGEIAEWWYEKITLKLAEDTRFTVDFFVLLTNGELEAYEVKGGFIMDDAKVKLKVAAALYPFRFYLAQLQPKKLGGGWTITEVKSETWSEAA